jgi:hypothetical protein
MHCTILEGDPKNKRRSPHPGALTTIYTYTETPHNVNGEIAHCFPPPYPPSKPQLRSTARTYPSSCKSQ